MAALVVLMLLILLPLATLSKIVLCGCLVLICVGLRYWPAKHHIKNLYIDVSNWKLGVNDSSAESQLVQADIDAEYFSAWLVVLKCEYGDHCFRLPVFRFMTSGKDFTRLLALVRSGSRQ